MSFELPGRILEEHTARKNRLGLVRFGDTTRPVLLDLVPEAHVGDYVRVHVGFATELVTEEEAGRAYQQLPKNPLASTPELALEAEEAQPAALRRRKPR